MGCSPFSRLCEELVVRLLLFVVFWITDFAEPFHRDIHEDELKLYQYPHVTSEHIPFFLLLALIVLVPCIVIGLQCSRSRDMSEASDAFLSYSLSVLLTGVITNVIKLAVGRPRPDFYRRCFPDGVAVYSSPAVAGILSFGCTGSPLTVVQGRKSFPSGHTSLAFAAFGFCSLYIAGKLRVFHPKRPAKALGVIIVTVPVMFAVLVGISRTCDYRHHWQDVVVGAILGSFLAIVSYRQYFPALTSSNCNVSLRSPECSSSMARISSVASFRSSTSSLGRPDIPLDVEKAA